MSLYVSSVQAALAAGSTLSIVAIDILSFIIILSSLRRAKPEFLIVRGKCRFSDCARVLRGVGWSGRSVWRGFSFMIHGWWRSECPWNSAKTVTNVKLFPVKLLLSGKTSQTPSSGIALSEVFSFFLSLLLFLSFFSFFGDRSLK